MRKIKILFLITDFAKGGAERYLVDLCQELNRHENIEYLVGSLFDNDRYTDFTDDIPIEQLDFNLFSLKRKNSNPRLQQIMEEFKPDIIHSHRFLAEFITSYYVDPTIKYVCHGHDNMIQLNRFKFSMLFNKVKFSNYIERTILRRKKYNKVKTHFIANSKHTESFYKRIFPKRISENVHLIQYGFNFKRFENLNNRVISTDSCLKLINVASFQDKKNQIFLVSVAEKLKEKNINFSLKLIGAGENRNKVIEKIQELGLEDCVEAPGISHVVNELYNESDIYVHAAYYEPFGLVFLEAMASGLPVVTLDGKGNRDIIEQDKNGFLFYVQDADKFADKIIEYATDQAKYSQISKYAREYSKQFDISTKTEELIEFYESLLESE